MIQTSLAVLAQTAALSFALTGVGLAQTATTEGDAAPEAATAEAPAAPLPTLPGGASSINDVYGSWTLACMSDANGPRCAVTQIQVNQQTEQRVLSAEMARGEAEGGAQGIVLLPFGLALDAGAVQELGEAKTDLRYTTCVPGGCILPITLDAAALAGDQVLNLTATIHETGEALTFSVPLAGLSQALERMDQVLAR